MILAVSFQRLATHLSVTPLSVTPLSMSTSTSPHLEEHKMGGGGWHD